MLIELIDTDSYTPVYISNDFGTIEVLDGGQVYPEYTHGVVNIIEIEVPGLQGPSGAPGGSTVEVESTLSISALKIVKVDNNNNLTVASCNDFIGTIGILGMSTSSTSTGGGSVVVHTVGRISDPSFNFTEGLPIFLSNNGNLTQDSSGLPFIKVIGYAINTNTILLSIEPTINII